MFWARRRCGGWFEEDIFRILEQFEIWGDENEGSSHYDRFARCVRKGLRI